MTEIRIHKEDLPDLKNYSNIFSIAVDIETLGLNHYRDRLCLVQISPKKEEVDIIQIRKHQKTASNIIKLLENTKILKIFHFARFDLAILSYTFKIKITPIFCTKIASKLSRTYTDRHSLRDLCNELLNVTIEKQKQSSDWGLENLTHEQIEYAATDVIYLHELKIFLENQLTREGRSKIAKSCFNFLPTRSELDLVGWKDQDIFSHN